MPEPDPSPGTGVEARSDDAPEQGGIQRRTVLGVLLGTAAGGVAGAITGRGGSGDGGSAEAAPPSTADAIRVEPTGELVAEDVQAALVDVVGRSSALVRLDDLRVATEVVDDFVVGDDRIGLHGWSTVTDGAQAEVAPVADEGSGVVRVDGGAGRAALHLGLGSERGLAVFTMEWRVQVTGAGRLVVGAVDAVDGSGADGLPDHGMYFVRDGDAPWSAVTASAEGRTVTETTVEADGDFHRLRITCDGSGIVRFWVDDDQVATSSETLPVEDAYGPALSVDGGAASVDWYYCRRERPR